MPVFSYKGVDAYSKNVSGTIDAESERAARIKLRRMRILPTHVVLGNSGRGLKNIKFFQRVSIEEISQMTRQMAILLQANIPLLDTLEALQDQIENSLMKKALSEIKDRVKEGGRLADCMQDYPKIFDNIYINMVRAGEASGQLEIVLQRLADFTENQAKLKGKVKSAMMYPAIMALVAIGMVTFLLLNVVPKIVTIILKMKKTLPLPTQILIAVTDFLQGYWWLVILISIGLFYLIRNYKSTPAGRKRFDEIKLKMPIFGDLALKVAVARFSRTLGTLLKSGVQLLQGLEIVRNVMDNVVLSDLIQHVMKEVKEGESLAETLKKSGRFPNMFLHMIRVGEKTGALDHMLERVADNYDQEVETFVDGLTSVLEPVMIVFMGGVIAFIVFAVLMPIMQLSQGA